MNKINERRIKHVLKGTFVVGHSFSKTSEHRIKFK